ncbi:unnamed protein product [Ostreobium quekettii]|uniref:Uncharacterized protein n=1 Tax=Ostreobium quekettii TaxID=121088 RepID=A0A8S1IXF9_9CHLO|nr:unnamed protein product [Ostreobium quekettii]
MGSSVTSAGEHGRQTSKSGLGHALLGLLDAESEASVSIVDVPGGEKPNGGGGSNGGGDDKDEDKDDEGFGGPEITTIAVSTALPTGVAAVGLATAVVGAGVGLATAPPIQPPSTSGVLSVTPLPAATPVTAAVAAALGSAILAGDINAAAQLFIESNDIRGLVLGLQIPPGISGSPSGDRNTNGDVVALKAVALAILSAAGLESKLTEVLVRAAIFPSQEAGNKGLTLEIEQLIDDVFNNLSNRDLLQRILDADANTVRFHADTRVLSCMKANSNSLFLI